MKTRTLITIASCAAAVAAHGMIREPPARATGPAMVKACGKQAVASVDADDTIPLEDVVAPLSTCKLDLCRGATWQDNKNLLQLLSAGDIVNFQIDLPIPHEGPCNVSVVDTQTNSVIGEPLISFDSYADEKLAKLPANNTNFDVVMPQLDKDECKKPGRCVLQWFWVGTAAKQTYVSCVDFVMT
ncbi:hypothetical protein CDD81_7931 [Ophiocordyceps australis]|uniref:Chitin-binding type-4 domain-containing protein n=1 Tax=Ophiocordyceps australis TaxID=1399860 RepID=A0A2C5XGK0_9HYPO|nr:hypothetical protein CDD81_7931 [Ophiocordyceps australis]